MAPKKPSSPSEGDIIAARAQVKLAELSRKVASWLPPKTEEEIAREARDLEEEDEEWREYEEKGVGYETYELGVGAKPPSKDAAGNIVKRTDPSLEALRKQLLGKKNGSKTPGVLLSKGISHRPVVAPKQVPQVQKRSARAESASDSDEGRGALFSKKMAKISSEPQKPAVETDVIPDGDGEVGMENNGSEQIVDVPSENAPNSKPKRKANSYLDEMLAEKAKKKKKKKKGATA